MLKCFECQKSAAELPEYVKMAKENDISPDMAVVLGENTYHAKTKRFVCTECYILMGMPAIESLINTYNLAEEWGV